MSRILILYSTTDGHTREICRRLRRVLEGLGDEVTLGPIDQAPDETLGRFDKIVLGASIRYGRHARAVYDFVARNRAILDSRPNAFFSVNAVARKPGRDRPGNNPYLQRFLRQIDWRPKMLAVFAGRIDYPSYRYWDRQMIRLIMWLTHGPTDPQATVEFTDWGQVEDFARRVSAM